MAQRINKLSDLSDRIGFTLLSAPDRFPTVGAFGSDQKKNLLIAFDILQEGFPLVEKKIKDPAQLEKLQQLLKDALLAYQQGERKKGAHLLQDFEEIVFPNRFKEYEERKGDNA
ncbi:hypothetical protein ABIE56_003701 [Luteibacter sp. 621]|uniref:hypothetical protein n=1 Tax=Luteibacter sp. 621 TaxID=3373916 RepID=UPI003D1C4854